MVEGYTFRNVSANAATPAGDKASGKGLFPDIRLQIDDRYGRSSVVVGGFANVAGIEDARNVSTTSWTMLRGRWDNNAATSTADKLSGKGLFPDIKSEIDGRYGRSSVVVGGLATEAGIEDARNKLTTSWTSS